MKKLKLKKKFKVSLFLIVLLVVLSIIGINKYKEYMYHKTNEYKLTQIGYSLKESKLIINKLSNKNEEYFIKNEKNDYIIDLIKSKYFLEKNLTDYLNYKDKNKKKDINDIVTIVNVHANKEWYDDKTVKETDLSLGNLILVNKYYYLKSDFVPENLTNISLSYSYANNSVTKETSDAFSSMASDAKKEEIQLLANSSYRTFEKQEAIYKDFYYSKGISYADDYAARAGYSEHQTGLAIDVFTKNSTTSDFATTDAYKWLVNNSYKYGFILRYPKDKENITGYNYESWHYRYLGVETATKVYESGLTYDEYYAYYIEK